MITITNREFDQLSTYIKENFGIYMRSEKKALIIGRLQNVLIQHGFHSFSEYYDYLVQDKSGMAVSTLLDKITTNHTFFMREADHFTYFKEVVLPSITANAMARDLRIWCAGCSSGEEPYTLAMIIDEYLGKDKFFWDSKILATDISTKVLDAAKKGIYRNEDLEPLPLKWKQDYINQLDSERSMITDKIRNEVIYRKFNLMERIFPFKKKFSVIFCRNVMIYFDDSTKNTLVNKYYDLLETGGYFFIGHSESLNPEVTKFKFVRPAVYRKI